jgi:hypothetical protein
MPPSASKMGTMVRYHCRRPSPPAPRLRRSRLPATDSRARRCRPDGRIRPVRGRAPLRARIAAAALEQFVDAEDAAVEADFQHDRGLVDRALVLHEGVHQRVDALAVLHAQAGGAAVDGADRFLDLGRGVGVQVGLGRDAAGGDVVLERVQAAEVGQPALEQRAHQRQPDHEGDQAKARGLDHQRPQLGGDLVGVEFEADHAVVAAADVGDAVDLVQLGGDQFAQPGRRRRPLDASAPARAGCRRRRR